MTETIENLLGRLSRIVTENQLLENKTAKSFNIFTILNITSDEVRLHSKFLAELMNPKGSHGQGTIFLKLFLEEIGEREFFKNLENTIVSIEYHIDFKTETTGGRIDILIQDQNRNALIIENKIFADDQENQLLRYYNYGKELGKNFRVYYLNRFGDSPKEKSTTGLSSNDYRIISYRETITSWLEKCENAIKQIPKLEMGILHYRQLIQQLTDQFYSNEMEQKAIEQIIKNTSNFEASQLVEQSMLEAKLTLLRQFSQKLEARLNENPLVKTIFLSPELGKKFHGMEIYLNEEIIESPDRSSHIRFSFFRDANDCYLEIYPGSKNGVHNEKTRIEVFKSELTNRFKEANNRLEDTTKGWQGDWVCRYNIFNNRFAEIIENDTVFFEKIVGDLNYIIEVFSRVYDSKSF